MFALSALLAVVVGCRGERESGAAGAAANASAPHAARIVSLAPNLTEILFAIGAGPKVVGVTRFCDVPPEALNLPKVGGFVDPSFEAVVRLNPDLVVSTGMAAIAPFERRLEGAGYAVVRAPMDDIAGVIEGIAALGGAVGHAERAAEVAQTLDANLRALPRVPGRPKVLVVYGLRPLVVAGPKTFAHDILVRLDAENVAADALVSYPTWSLEQVVRAAPDVVLDARMDGGDDPFWAQWKGVPAVENGRVFSLALSAALRPGPRLGAAAAEIARCLNAPGRELP